MTRNKIRLLRIWKGYTQKEMAKLLEIEFRMYREIEENALQPDYQILEKVENLFNLKRGTMLYRKRLL